MISVTIPEGVTSIGASAFANCTYLTSVTISEGVTSIGSDAFRGCRNLKTVYNNSSLDIVKGSETHGYVAFYADKVFTHIDGVYYMKNVGAGLFLTGGNAWGTQGTFSENGFDVTVTTLPSGKYVIDTKVDNRGNHYLGADGFIDAPRAEWTIEQQTDGTYTITNDGVNYIGYDGSTAVLNLHLTNSSEDNARWQFMTYEEVMAEISTATKDNPKTVTMLLPGAAFNQGDTRNGLWSDAPEVGGYQTEFGSNKCGYKRDTPSFDVAQTLTKLPNGYYKISMQGFYRMGGDGSQNDATIAAENHAAGTETLNAIFYANNEEKPLMSIIEGAQTEMFAYGKAFNTSYGYVPQDIDAAAAAFTDGKYEHSLWVEVTDGTLRVGVKKNAKSVNDWTVVDNFRLVYYGNPASGISIDRASMKLLNGESMTLSAEVTPEDATDAVTWSSSDASVAIVDQNGHVTAVGAGTATITATAGDYSATCEVTVTMQESFVSLTDGVYYMKNVGAGLFLTGGNAWGTQGTFSENGFDVTVTALPSGKYVIDTKVDNWGNHYLGADGFIDAPQAEWAIELQTDGTYTITNDGVNYIGYDGSTTVLNLHLTNPSEDNARWQFMTYEEVMAEICTATKDNPKTVTMLLPGAAFNQGDTRNGVWSDKPAVGGYQTKFGSNKCGEKWNTPSFDVAQTLTNLPNGYYKISMQGFYRMGGDSSKNDATIAAENHAAGTETLNAIFYANNEEKPLMSIIEGAQTEMFAYGKAFNTSYGYVPQDMDAAAAAFTDGKYEHSLWVKVTDGTLRVGVKKDAESVRDWTIFDNFRIVYYGKYGISIDRASMKLLKGETMTLSAEVTSEDATNKTVTWSSSNASVATVDQNGHVTAVGAGTTTITATAGDYSATCEVTVAKQEVSAWEFDESTGVLRVYSNYNYAYSFSYPWYSFRDNIKSVEFTSNVTSIGESAFFECSSLGSVTIPSSVTSIGESAFFKCSSLNRVDITDLTAWCRINFEDLGSNPLMYAHHLYLNGEEVKDLVIPEGVTSIGKYAFYKCSLTSVTIPYSVTSIGFDAFCFCVNLKTVYNNSSLDIVKGSKTHGYVAFYADKVLTLTEGVYYMKNVGAGLFLTGGNAWGTQGTFSENGFDVTVTALPSGKYVIDTKVDNRGNHYLGADGFIDAPQAEWTIERQTDGTYTITNDGVNYIGYDGSTTVLNLNLTNPSEDNARWQFMTYEEVMAEICTATKDNPKTVTMLLPGAAFNQGDTRNGLWSDAPRVGGYQTEFGSNKCGEKWNTTSFDVAQTLINLPNGYYKISMQGFYRMGGDSSKNDATIASENHAAGTETLNAIFYANNEEKPLMSIIEGAQAEEFAYGQAFNTLYGYVPQNMDAAAAAFTDGKYEHSLWVEVTDGTLRVGVKKDAESVRDWTIFDNFRIVYYGTQQPDAIEEATAIVTFQTNDVYDLSGRLVRRQTESLDGLKPGVYIINGKKYMVK